VIMGKAALILVAAVTVASGVTYLNQDRQQFEGAMQETLYQHGVLAREVAKSGFNTLLSRVKGDFDAYRILEMDRASRIGRLDMAAAGATGGPVTLSVTGHYGEAEFSISGTMERSGGSLLDALTIDGPQKKIEFKDRADVSGIDTDPDGTAGGNSDVHAIRSVTIGTHAEVLERMPADFGWGASGENDAIQGNPTAGLAGIVTAIKDYEGDNLSVYGGKQKFEDDTFGSTEAPVVLRVSGDLELKGTTTGYGILYVEGDLKMKDDSRWEGLVIASADKGKFEVTDDARVYGAMVVSAFSEDGPGGDSNGGGGLPGGHFDVDVFDAVEHATKEIYHEHQYDDDFDVTGVNLLSPTGCKSNGGLCWNEVLGSAGNVYVEFFNASNSKGSYRIKDGSGLDITGDPADGLGPTLVNAASIEEFWVEFDALCYLQESSPGDVQSDATNRNGAFTIRISNAAGPLASELAPDNARMAGLAGMAWINAVAARVVTLFAQGPKVDVCHIPPGNPANAHIIQVSENAVPAHLAHGDTLDECAAAEDESEEDEATGTPPEEEAPAGETEGEAPAGVGSLVYELSVYHHINEDFPCVSVDMTDDEANSTYGEPIELKLKKDSLIQYSSQSLSNALSLLNGYAIEPGAVTLTNVMESGVRAKVRLRTSLQEY
jgi:hypothetical protein